MKATDKSMSSYGKAPGDVSGAKFCGRVDVYWLKDKDTRGQVQQHVFWTGFDHGAVEEATATLAKLLAYHTGGKIVDSSPPRNGPISEGCSRSSKSSPTAQIVVVE